MDDDREDMGEDDAARAFAHVNGGAKSGHTAA